MHNDKRKYLKFIIQRSEHLKFHEVLSGAFSSCDGNTEDAHAGDAHAGETRLDEWQVGIGLMGEQGADAYFNNVERHDEETLRPHRTIHHRVQTST